MVNIISQLVINDAELWIIGLTCLTLEHSSFPGQLLQPAGHRPKNPVTKGFPAVANNNHSWFFVAGSFLDTVATPSFLEIRGLGDHLAPHQGCAAQQLSSFSLTSRKLLGPSDGDHWGAPGVEIPA